MALNGINLALIAQKSLDFMARQFMPVRAFHRDFSMDVPRGDNVTTRVATAVTAVDVSAGYTAQAVDTTAVTVTLNQNPGFPWAFTDLEIERAAYDLNWLRQIFIEPATEAIVNAVMQYSLGLFTAANFANSVTKTASQFDADVLADNAISLSTLKAAMTERATILKPTYYGNVAKDSIIEDFASSGSTDALREMNIGRCRGFNIFQVTDIPDNGENFQGVSLHPSALALAARPQMIPQNFTGQVENIIEPVSGMPLQWRYWYEASLKKTFLSVETWFGASKGNGTAAIRIKSA